MHTACSMYQTITLESNINALNKTEKLECHEHHVNTIRASSDNKKVIQSHTDHRYSITVYEIDFFRWFSKNMSTNDWLCVGKNNNNRFFFTPPPLPLLHSLRCDISWIIYRDYSVHAFVLIFKFQYLRVDDHRPPLAINTVFALN